MNHYNRKYSIVVVTRNNAEGLQRTLQSIRSLHYADKETVVIDGASSDQTHELLSANSDIIAKAISEKDTGIYNAMNKGIAHVTGDYVVFMNAGDTFAHDDVLSVVSKSEGDILLGGETYGGQVRMPKEQMTLYDILSIGINHQAVYYRREILQQYGFDESYKIIADLKSVVEPLAKDKISISCIPDILAICEGGGLSKKRWRDALVEKQRIIEEVVDPFYREDYHKFSRIHNDLLPDLMVLSAFRSIFPFIKILAKVLRFLNKRVKQIPLYD